ERGIDDQRRRKYRLEIRFIPTGKRPPCVGGFELRRGERLCFPVPVLVGAPIESSKLVVERAAKPDMQSPLARDQWSSHRQCASLQRLVEGYSSRLPLSRGVRDH